MAQDKTHIHTFDAGCKTNGKSKNDLLELGPDELQRQKIGTVTICKRHSVVHKAVFTSGKEIQNINKTSITK